MSSTYTSSRLDGEASRPRRRSTTTSSTNSNSEFLRGSRRSTMDFTGSQGSNSDLGEEEWEQGAERVRARSKRDEPMSPVVVVLYVTALYIIFQILTRSDDHEILSHLPLHSPFSSSSPHALNAPNVHSDMHHFPQYHFPQISSPIPSSTSDSATGFWRFFFGVLVYPFYIVITLLAIPLPFLLNALQLVLSVAATILYPVTSTLKILTKAFIVGPWGITRSILTAFYPIYTFVAGVVGVGCMMGLGAGWVGRVTLDSFTKDGRRKKRKEKRRKEKALLSSQPSRIVKTGPSPMLENVQMSPGALKQNDPNVSIDYAEVTRPGKGEVHLPHFSTISKLSQGGLGGHAWSSEKKRSKLASIQHFENYRGENEEGPHGQATARVTPPAVGVRKRVHTSGIR